MKAVPAPCMIGTRSGSCPDRGEVSPVTFHHHKKAPNMLTHNAYRVLVGGIVVAVVESRLGERFGLSLCNAFADNLRKAQTDPTWNFDRLLSGPEWLRGHEIRLGCPLRGAVRVIGPGRAWPLAPNLFRNA
jgi:hypothetical protein